MTIIYEKNITIFPSLPLDETDIHGLRKYTSFREKNINPVPNGSQLEKPIFLKKGGKIFTKIFFSKSRSFYKITSRGLNHLTITHLS